LDDNGDYPSGSINRRVAAKLASFTRRLRSLSQDSSGSRGGQGRD